jgi:DNA-binding GntR family transcriptional regulator
MPKKGSFIPLPTPEDASQVFFAREAVEGQAAAAAALHATPEEVEALRRYIAGDEEAVLTRSREQFSSNNELLHLGIARASRNTYLEKWCRNIFWRSNVYVFYFDGFYRPDTLLPQKRRAARGDSRRHRRRDPSRPSQCGPYPPFRTLRCD